MRSLQALLTVRRPQMSRAAVVGALLRMAELSGACMPGRGKGVAAAATILGRGVGMRPMRVVALAEAAQLLDIGLIGLPQHVAQHCQPLSEDDEADFELHPMRSLELARDLGLMYEALNGIMHHHERHDGRGYPMGLSGHEIPEFARILAIADEFDRMTRDGPGGVKLPAEDAMRKLRAFSGTQFDPELVEVFSHVFAEGQTTEPGI